MGQAHLERRLRGAAARAVVLCLLASLAACRSSGSSAERSRLVRRLSALAQADRRVRGEFFSPALAALPPEERRARLKDLDARIVAVDRRNTAELKALLATLDWFTVDEFGAQADLDAWLLVQHADLDAAFQKDVLRRLERLAPSGRTSPANFAFLYDRVAVRDGRRQRYGTQGDCAGPGVWRPGEVEEPALLDERRAAVGLPPLAAYVAQSGTGCR